MVHQAVWYLSVILILFIAALFVMVVAGSRKKEAYEPIQKKGYAIRKVYFIGLLAVLLLAIAWTTRQLPYDKHPGSGEPVVVRAEAVQFGWILSQDKFEAGRQVEFRVTSRDVNHGFGIYDENMLLLGQTQAMPQYTNKLYITFDKPGKYQILCMEYCGIAHHLMIGELEVVAPQEGGLSQ